jgi:hypothetical protein
MWARGGALHELSEQRHLIWEIIGALAFPAQVSLLVAALFIVWWPVAIGLIIFILVLGGLLVTHADIVQLTRVRPVLNITTIFSACFIWSTLV